MTEQPKDPQIERVPSLGFAFHVDLGDLDYAQIVRECFRRSGLNQKQFAKLAGASEHSMCVWLKARGKPPRLAARAAMMALQIAGTPVKVTIPDKYLTTTAKS